MTAAIDGRAGIGKLLRRYIRWRVGAFWYLLVFVGIPLLLVLVPMLMAGSISALLSGLPLYPITYIGVFFLGGPFLEEPGWRGFALPRLQQRLGPLRGSLLLGVLWGFWHLPLFFIPGYNGAGSGFVGISTAMLTFIVATSALSIVFAWVSNRTGGSLFLVMLLHASINSSGSLAPAFANTLVNQIMTYIILFVFTLIIIIATRGRLSYDRYLRETEPSLPDSPALDRLI
ncbi:hypothetical protein KDI_34930 [Dictyobacter arantiisoli]|uniref:CAAX prenyl protease 2/Lysostaphin resistance protein A-like domain-containing protein n=2 Tax=Dictyobacter arantiisoli TaxID=2014874 RepID=A0A5A5TG03_9CHLR|nr:hypothetical protein KDI_34930 [Dictyobacter arantiisoli]